MQSLLLQKQQKTKIKNFLLHQCSRKGCEAQGCFKTVFFQGFNYSFKCRYIDVRRIRCVRCLVVILIWILIYVASSIAIIGIYVVGL